MSESRSSEQVSDLTALNAVKERDIIYNGAQNGDSGTMEFVNSLDISVTAKSRRQKSGQAKDRKIMISRKSWIML